MVARYPFVAASVAVATAAIVTQYAGWLALLPFHWSSWAVWPLATLVLFTLLVATEVRHDAERKFVTDRHRKDLHAEAASRLFLVSQNGSCGGAWTLIGKSFAIHFPKAAEFQERWNDAVSEQQEADQALEKEIATREPGYSQMVASIIRGEFDPDQFQWDLRTDPKGRSYVYLTVGRPGNETYFQPREGEDGQAALDRISTFLGSVATWPAVTRRQVAHKSRDELREKFIRRLERIQRRDEIKRDRRCELCFPGED